MLEHCGLQLGGVAACLQTASLTVLCILSMTVAYDERPYRSARS